MSSHGGGHFLFVFRFNGVKLLVYFLISYIMSIKNQLISPSTEVQQLRRIDITAASIKTLVATPAELVPAPGAGKTVIVDQVEIFLFAGTEVLAESADNLGVEYDDGTGTAIVTAIETTGFIDQAVDQMMVAVPIVLAGTTVLGTNENKNVALINDSGEFTGNASNDATIRVYVKYHVVDTANDYEY